jgi:uncharacterized delta-60 repeat protein
MARKHLKFYGRQQRTELFRRKKSLKRWRNNLGRTVDLGMEKLEPRWVLASPGSLDTTFDLDGVVFGEFGSTARVELTSTAVQSDGKIVVAGTITNPLTFNSSIVVARFNSNGSLDTTFGDNDSIGGYTTFTFNSGAESFAHDLAIDSTGRIVVVGRGKAALSSDNGFGVARLGTDGELDTSFDTDGMTVTLFATGVGFSSEARGVAIQSDGKIVVAGTEDKPNSATGRDDFAVARYNSNGSLDTSFGVGGTGKVVTGFNDRDDKAFDVVLQQVGAFEKILVVGEADRTGLGINDFALARYNPDGSLDTAGDGFDAVQFGIGGKVTTLAGLGSLAQQVSQITAVALDPLGRIVVGGTVGDINVTTDMVIGRYSADGSLDTATFNPSPSFNAVAGTQHIHFTTIDVGNSLLVQPDGQYVIGGVTRTTFATETATWRWGLARVNASNGSLDSTFGTGGLAQAPAFPDGGLSDPPFEPAEPDSVNLAKIALTPDGKIVGAGYQDLETTDSDYLIARYETGLLTADAGGPYALNEPGGSVVLSGSAVGSAPFVFEWDLDGDTIFGETGAGAANGDEVGAHPTFTVSGVDGPNNTFTVTLRVTDSTTFQAFDTATINVLNVAPTLAISGAASVNEGDGYTLNLSSSDPGPDTISGWTINWGDSTEIVSGNPTSVSHTYADGDASYTITATATDEDGTFAAGNTVAVTVHDVAPTLAISGAASVNEGAVYTLSLTSSDPGTDAISQWTINWGDSIEVVSGNPASVTHTYADGTANYTISASATNDDDTFVAGNTVAVTVNNVVPTLAISGAASVNEGSTYTLNLSSSDPGADMISSWTINWGDSIQVVSGNPASVTHVYADGNGSSNYAISATATDEDGTHAAGNTVAVAVVNVAPTANAGGPYATFDDTPITLAGSGTDPAGAADPLTFQWDLDGDNVFGETGVGATRGNEVGASVTYNPTGLPTSTQTVKLQVSDGDGGVTLATTTVQILGQGTLAVGGVLYIVGGNSNDIVFITRCNDTISVYATFNSSNPQMFDASLITDIQVRTRGGNDVVVTTCNVMQSMTIDGGTGNDLLTGGGGRSVVVGGTGNDILYGAAGDDILFGGDGNDDLFGGNGNDVLVGGNGNDILNGGSGRDVMIGSQDNDRLDGGIDDDVLVGGVTIHDNNVAALDAVMAIWNSADSFSTRVATLTASGGLLEAGVAVFDDDDHDTLVGGAGRDLYFGDNNPSDHVTDSISLQALQDQLIAVT